jgi:hypothetical protein
MAKIIDFNTKECTQPNEREGGGVTVTAIKDGKALVIDFDDKEIAGLFKSYLEIVAIEGFIDALKAFKLIKQ